MSNQVGTLHVNGYEAAITLLAQQKESRLAGRVMVGSQRAKKHFVNQTGIAVARKKTHRHAKTEHSNTPHGRRMITTVPYYYSDLVDDWDEVQTLSDPSSSYVEAAVAALNRARDDEIIAALDGTAYEGEEGATAVTFPAANEVAVDHVVPGETATNSNFTLEKWRKMSSILYSGEAIDPGDDVTIVMAQLQIDSAIRTTEVNSVDYNIIRPLVTGTIEDTVLMGMRIVRSERLPKTGNNRRIFAFVRKGIRMNTGMERKIRVTEESLYHFSAQVYAAENVGATRLQEAMVSRCLCDETAA